MTTPQPEQPVRQILEDLDDGIGGSDRLIKAEAALNRQALATALRIVGDDDEVTVFSGNSRFDQSVVDAVAGENKHKAELRQAFTDYYGDTDE